MMGFGIDTDALVHAAVQAPSSHNTQPWRFVETPEGVDLYADGLRALLVSDPAWRELVISCGAALLNFRVAAAAHGHGVRVEREPLHANERLCRILRTPEAPDAALADLADAIAMRHTDRKPFRSDRPSDPVRERLQSEARLEGAELRFLDTPAERDAAVQAIVQGEHLLWDNLAWREEAAWWMRPPTRGDGLNVPAWMAPVARAMIRHVDLGDRMASQDAELAAQSPLLAVLQTASDTPEAWLSAGQALERVLLQATRMGLNASFLSAALEVPATRERLTAALGGGGALQMLMRLGYSVAQPEASARRPLSDVLQPPI